MGDEDSGVEKKETTAGRRGRSAFVPSDEQRDLVRKLAAEGTLHPAIATAVSVSVPTLRKAFAEELKERLGDDNLFVAAGEPKPDPAPVPAKPKRKGAGGRKPWQPSTADREKAAVLVSAGMGAEELARIFDKAEPTIRRRFAAELDTGALRKRAEVLAAMHRNALKGNVAAQKEILAIMDRARLEELQDQVRGGKAKTEPAASDSVGKKVQADLDAHGVVTQGPWAGLIRQPQKAS